VGAGGTKRGCGQLCGACWIFSAGGRITCVKHAALSDVPRQYGVPYTQGHMPWFLEEWYTVTLHALFLLTLHTNAGRKKCVVVFNAGSDSKQASIQIDLTTAGV
jgi:hypothetical protein